MVFTSVITVTLVLNSSFKIGSRDGSIKTMIIDLELETHRHKSITYHSHTHDPNVLEGQVDVTASMFSCTTQKVNSYNLSHYVNYYNIVQYTNARTTFLLTRCMVPLAQ